MALLRPDTIVLNWLLALPFFAAAGAVLFPRLSLQVRSSAEAEALRRGPYLLGALASLMGAALTVSLLPAISTGGAVTADYWWTRDVYHLRFQADVFTVAVLAVIYGLGLVINLHLAGLVTEEDAHRRAALVLAAQGGAAAACLSADLVALLFFLELALVAVWVLASLEGVRAGSWMLALVYGGGLVALGGVLLMWRETGETSLAAFPLLLVSAEPPAVRAMTLPVLVGLAPRLGGVPGHGWVPGVAAAAPRCALVPALLLPVVGGAVLLRLLPGAVLMPVAPAAGGAAIVLGIVSLWWGALRAGFARELRQLAAWLTVAQSGFLLLALGLAANPVASAMPVEGGALHLLAAAAGLLGLWTAAGTVRAIVGTDAVAALSGLWRQCALAGVVALVAGLSLVGVPPLPGYQVQRLLLSAALKQGQIWLAIAMVGGDVVMAVAVLAALRRVFLGGEESHRPAWGSAWLSLALLLSLGALIAGAAWAGPLCEWSEQAVRAALTVSAGGMGVSR